MPPNQVYLLDSFPAIETEETKIRVAILGCGMMGQEHISYISGYSNLRIDFLCDPHEPSLTKAYQVLESFQKGHSLHGVSHTPQKLVDEQQLLDRVHLIDLLVIATPNYLHTPSLLKWAKHDIYILVEKPVAVSHEQLQQLENLNPTARIWVAMEYRYIPAIAKLQQLLPDIGDIKMITIRENRYPFLEKVGDWNRDIQNTGDTLVEKCCHFWDLFRLLSSQEIDMKNMRSMVQRGLNYKDEPNPRETPIIDSAYVIVPFLKPIHLKSKSGEAYRSQNTMGVLELCMYAEGSRHQEEIIVTGTKVCVTMMPS
jgi:myo-inositol 2-dehydrogenase / D-chiro-inositol 1-dehydrogenase